MVAERGPSIAAGRQTSQRCVLLSASQAVIRKLMVYVEFTQDVAKYVKEQIIPNSQGA